MRGGRAAGAPYLCGLPDQGGEGVGEAQGGQGPQDDPEHQKNFKDAADKVAKGMAARRKKLDLGKGKKEKK